MEDEETGTKTVAIELNQDFLSIYILLHAGDCSNEVGKILKEGFIMLVKKTSKVTLKD